MAMVTQDLALGHWCAFPTCQAPWKMPERWWRISVGLSELCGSCWGSMATCAPMARRWPSQTQDPPLSLTTCP